MKKFIANALTIAIPVFTISCMSVSNKANGGSTKQMAFSKEAEKARIQKKWQQQFLNIVNDEADNNSTTWALFSYGGWVDQGQVFVFSSLKSTPAVKYASPASKVITDNKTLTTIELSDFSSLEKSFSGLKDLENEVYDGLQYEYVKAKKDQKGNIEIVQRVFMNNPGVGKPAKEYTKLVKTFSDLKPQPKEK